MSSILILGGYGGFGARLSRRLAAAGHIVLVAGRHLDRAEKFCAALDHCRPIAVDRERDLGPLLAAERPTLVIDAAGPFQNMSYSVPRACIAAGIAYLDIADGRTFVCGIGTLDAAARGASVPIVSGASSVPALSGAAVRRLTESMEAVTAIEVAISASNRAAAGRSVAAAILSYVGRPIRLWRGQRWTTGFGWQDVRIERFGMDDGTSLGHRWTALADVPDLDLLPDRVAGRPAVTFRAGTELTVQNIALWLAGWPVRWGWLHSLRPLAGLLLPLQGLTRNLGSDRSGMVVRVIGLVDGRRIERRWTLIASDGDGPEIPTLPAALLAEQIVADRIAPGARDAGPLLALADFEPAFRNLAIRHEICERARPEPLYARVMGARFAQLAPAVRAMHSVLADGGAHGRATVTGGRNLLARLIAAIMRFPTTGEHILHVTFREHGGHERWTRDFSGRRFSSRLSQHGPYLVERFGPFRFRFDLPGDGNGLRMVMRGWSLAHLPLPLALAPRSEAREWEADGRFCFDVPIALPLIGLVVHYRGWLTPPLAPDREPQ